MTDPFKNPPADVVEQFAAVNAALDRMIPAKTANNLLIGTWNVRAFDRVDSAWR